MCIYICIVVIRKISPFFLGASFYSIKAELEFFKTSGRTQAVQKRPWLLQKAGMNRILAQKLWVKSGFRSVDSFCVCAYQVCFFVVASKMYGSNSKNGRSGVIRFMLSWMLSICFFWYGRYHFLYESHPVVVIPGWVPVFESNQHQSIYRNKKESTNQLTK